MTKIGKRLAAVLLAVAMVVTFVPVLGTQTAYAASGDPALNLGTDVLDENVNTSTAQTVWYADKAWRVIGYDGKDGGAASKTGAVTLLAAENLEQAPFDESSPYSNVYAESTLKAKVDAIAGSFSVGEQGAIVKKTLVHGDYNVEEPLKTDCIAGEEDIEDVLLWPLSTKEANAVSNDLRIVDPDHTSWATSFWWLRSPGAGGSSTAIVRGDGGVGEGGDIARMTYGVRPAFDLNLESVLFTSAAESGKSSGTEGADALKAQSDQTNSGNEWKVTVKDTAHAGFAISKTTPTENGVSVEYTGAQDGTGEYISAIITDKPITEAGAKITCYGRVKSCAAPSDTVMINTAGKLRSGDTLYVFNEKYNGDKKTDYASTLQKVTIPKLAPVTKVSGTLLAKITAKGKSSLVLTWSKVKGAEGYDIFFAKCGKNDKNALKKVKTIKGNKTFKWTKKNLKTKKAYKAVVKAYVKKNGKKTYVRTGPMVHAYTSGGTSKYTNAKSVTVKKLRVSLKAGKTYKIKANVVKLQKGKKLVPTSHAPKLRYVSSNKKIATVSKTGKITAKSKGSCKVYVIAVNGASKAVSVTVK